MTQHAATEPILTLTPMTPDDLDAFIREQIVDCARKHSEEEWEEAGAPAGGLPPAILARAEREIATILRWQREAVGQDHQLLLAARTPAGATVGWLWVKLPPPGQWVGSAFLCQMTVVRKERRRGYGRAMLAALERDLAARGMSELRLNVWDENDAAKALYTQAGYAEVQHCETLLQLCKPLGPEREVVRPDAARYAVHARRATRRCAAPAAAFAMRRYRLCRRASADALHLLHQTDASTPQPCLMQRTSRQTG